MDRFASLAGALSARGVRYPVIGVWGANYIAIPVARLSHIVESKARAGREKDRLFLATHREALDYMVSEDDPSD